MLSRRGCQTCSVNLTCIHVIPPFELKSTLNSHQCLVFLLSTGLDTMLRYYCAQFTAPVIAFSMRHAIFYNLFHPLQLFPSTMIRISSFSSVLAFSSSSLPESLRFALFSNHRISASHTKCDNRCTMYKLPTVFLALQCWATVYCTVHVGNPQRIDHGLCPSSW